METTHRHEYGTLFSHLFRHEHMLAEICYMGLAVVILAILSNIQIPLWPVPITMQTFGIFLIAFFFGSRKGAVTILAYILAGIAGFGVFASYKSGWSVIIGATGGYIIGFVIAAYVIGRLIEKGYGRKPWSIFWCLVAGNAIIYAGGLVGLWHFFPDQSAMTILQWGLFPFLIGDFVKILCAMGLFPLLWTMGKRSA